MQTPKDDRPVDIILNGVIVATNRQVKDKKAKRVSILPIDPKMQMACQSSSASLQVTPMSGVSLPQHISDIKMFEEGFATGEFS